MKKTRWTIMVMVLAFLLLPMGKAEAGTKAGAGGYKLSVSQQTLTAGKKCTIRLKKAGKWRRAFIVCGHCGKAMCKYNNGKSYRCRSGHVKLNALEL